MLRTIILILVFLTTFSNLALSEPPDYWCGADLNGNGIIEDTEKARCVETPEGWSCPVGEYECDASFTDPVCPGGGTLDPQADKCIAPPLIQCPDGYSYDTVRDVCIAQPTCPGGEQPDPATDTCRLNVASLCPGGYQYDSTTDTCWHDIVCPSGGIYDPVQNRCETAIIYTCPQEYTLNSQTERCETPPACTSGSYDPFADLCVTAFLRVCPTNYPYDTQYGKCVTSYVCPDGSSITSSGYCTLPQSNVVCSYGVFDANSGYCIDTGLPPYCESGGTVDLSIPACVLTPTYTCPSGYNLYEDSTTVGCVAEPQPPSCPDLTYQYGTIDGGTLYEDLLGNYMCIRGPLSTEELSIIYNSQCSTRCGSDTSCWKDCIDDLLCPSGWGNWQVVDGVETLTECFANIQCGIGSTWNPERDRCEMDSYPAIAECPSESWSYDPVDMACYTNPVCPQGFVDISSEGKCIIPYATSCPDGYTYDSNLDRCIQDPVCPQGSTYDTVEDLCRASSTIECPTPTWYTLVEGTSICRGAPVCPPESSYSTERKKCVLSQILSCPQDMSWLDGSPESNLCVADASCPDGSTLNAQTGRCETSSWEECPPDYTLVNGVCETAPPCPTGSSYDATLDKCVQEALPTCPADFAYDVNTSLCWSAPVCPAEATYDTTDDRCEYQPPIDYFCPVNNLTYGSPDSCASECTRTAECTLPTPSFSGSTGSAGCSGSGRLVLQTDGSNIYLIDTSGDSTVALSSSVCVFDGTSIEIPYCNNYVYFTITAGTDNQLRITGRTYTDTETISIFDTTWSVSGCTVTGSLSVFGSDNAEIGLRGAETELVYPYGVSSLGSYTTAGSLSFTALPVCPLGDFQCDANNMCTETVSCMALVNCPEGYTRDGTICWQQAWCVSTDATLNYATDRCEIDPSYRCPQGFALNGNICVTDVSCPESGTLDTTDDVCRVDLSRMCPDGFDLEVNADGTSVCHTAPLCPSGSTYSVEYGMCVLYTGCPQGYTTDPLGYCLKEPTCLNEGVFIPESDICEVSAVNTCPQGWTYNAVRDACFTPSSCTGQGMLNTGTDLCEVTTSCPNGYYLDASSGACIAEPLCPDSRCPFGYTQRTDGLCEGMPVCPPGYTYDPTTFRCEGIPECAVDGYTFDPETGKCEGPPVCPDGATYENGYCTATPQCSLTNSSGNLCTNYPYTVTGYNSSTGMCEFYPLCQYGGTFEPSTGLCVKDPSCYVYSGYDTYVRDNYTYDPETQRCMGPPKYSGTCPDGFYYSSYYGKCVSTSDVTSCYGNGYVYNPQKFRCESDSSYWCPSDQGATMSFDSTRKRCVSNSYCFYLCPSGMVYDSSTGKCRTWGNVTSCPQGYSYDDTTGKCISSGQDADVVVCSAGSYDISTRKCYVVNDCSHSFIPDGGQGYWLDTTTGMCLGPVISRQLVKTDTLVCRATPTWCENLKEPPPSGRCCSEGTYDPSTGVCDTGDGSCPQSDPNSSVSIYWVLDTNIDLCRGDTASYVCPSNYEWTRWGDSMQCVKKVEPDCPGDSNYVGELGMCFTSIDNIYCPRGYWHDSYRGLCIGSIYCQEPSFFNYQLLQCVVNPSCPGGWYYNSSLRTCVKWSCPEPAWEEGTFGGGYKGWFDSSNYICYVSQAYTCPAGSSLKWDYYACDFDPSSKCWDARCTTQVYCPSGGTMDPQNNVCYTDTEPACPSGYTIDIQEMLCIGEVPACDQGVLQDNRCVLDASTLCPAGYAFHTDTDECVMAPPYCPTGGEYLYDSDECSAVAEHQCPTLEYLYDSSLRICMMDPVCDTVYNPERDKCYASDPVCPIGDYACMNVSGVYKCSPYQCVDLNQGIEYTDFTPIEYQDDGTINQQGECSGTFYVFSGHGGICRPPGTQTVYTNCCSYDEGDVVWCGEDTQTAYDNQEGKCHYIGEYCAERWFLIGCVQKAKSYCCFNSKLARIVHEQGRPQLKSFGPDGDWGTPESPNCRGFTPEEFQMLDWKKMDLSEYFNDVIQRMEGNTPAMMQNMQNKIQEFYQRYGQ